MKGLVSCLWWLEIWNGSVLNLDGPLQWTTIPAHTARLTTSLTWRQASTLSQTLERRLAGKQLWKGCTALDQWHIHCSQYQEWVSVCWVVAGKPCFFWCWKARSFVSVCWVVAGSAMVWRWKILFFCLLQGMSFWTMKLGLLHLVDLRVASHIYGNFLAALVNGMGMGRAKALVELNKMIATEYQHLGIQSGNRLPRPNVSDIFTDDFPCLRHVKGRRIRKFAN